MRSREKVGHAIPRTGITSLHIVAYVADELETIAVLNRVCVLMRAFVFQVDNLTYRTTPDDLRRVFERCGEVGDIYIPRDRHTRESRGFAFVR